MAYLSVRIMTFSIAVGSIAVGGIRSLSANSHRRKPLLHDEKRTVASATVVASTEEPVVAEVVASLIVSSNASKFTGSKCVFVVAVELAAKEKGRTWRGNSYRVRPATPLDTIRVKTTEHLARQQQQQQQHHQGQVRSVPSSCLGFPLLAVDMQRRVPGVAG